MFGEPLQFPPLTLPLDEAWAWPRPPFAWRHSASNENTAVEACRIETASGAVVEGAMLAMDPAAGRLRFRLNAEGEAVKVPFASFRRLTLIAPLKAPEQRAGGPIERVPAAAQERDYRLLSPESGQPPLTGRTAGHVEADEGLYLFTPIDEERSLQRVFVPRWAYTRSEFGISAEEEAAARWIADPVQLLQAIERQQRMPVLPIGQSLLALGMLTQQQLERALAEQPSDVPLGEMLVAAGMISRTNLRTALAHKMGYPLVDLARFPIEPAAAKKLTLRMALESSALPIMIDGQRLIVVVDRPARAVKLRNLHAFAQLTLVPVLASKSRILEALTRLAQQDVWSENVSMTLRFFETTT